MYRSFTNRVLGGVCGGIAASLPFSGWFVRLIFIALTLITLGAFGVAYGILWVALPQESLVRRGRGGALWAVFTLGVVVLVVAGWYGRVNGLTALPSGGDLYYPVLALVFSVIFFLRQLGGSR